MFSSLGPLPPLDVSTVAVPKMSSRSSPTAFVVVMTSSIRDDDVIAGGGEGGGASTLKKQGIIAVFEAVHRRQGFGLKLFVVSFDCK